MCWSIRRGTQGSKERAIMIDEKAHQVNAKQRVSLVPARNRAATVRERFYTADTALAHNGLRCAVAHVAPLLTKEGSWEVLGFATLPPLIPPCKGGRLGSVRGEVGCHAQAKRGHDVFVGKRPGHSNTAPLRSRLCKDAGAAVAKYERAGDQDGEQRYDQAPGG